MALHVMMKTFIIKCLYDHYGGILIPSDLPIVV